MGKGKRNTKAAAKSSKKDIDEINKLHAQINAVREEIKQTKKTTMHSDLGPRGEYKSMTDEQKLWLEKKNAEI